MIRAVGTELARNTVVAAPALPIVVYRPLRCRQWHQHQRGLFPCAQETS